jgi:hypothetical protein
LLFILKNKNFLINFLINFSEIIYFLHKVQFSYFNKIVFQLIFNPNKTLLGLKIFLDKISNYFFNLPLIIKNYEIFLIFKNNLKSFLIRNLSNRNFLFDRFLVSYRAFLNTNLYLTRSSLFLTNLSTNAFNFLLLKNFNKIFYWTGDINLAYPFTQKFIWSKQSLLFWQGTPYDTIWFGNHWSNFLLPSLFHFNEQNFLISNKIYFNQQKNNVKFSNTSNYKFFFLSLLNQKFFFNFLIS